MPLRKRISSLLTTSLLVCCGSSTEEGGTASQVDASVDSSQVRDAASDVVSSEPTTDSTLIAFEASDARDSGDAAREVEAGPPAIEPPRVDLSSSVDPLLGSSGEGHVFPGPALPFGMVKIGPDSVRPDVNSGYLPDGDIAGFSHLHVSGTGGGPKYGVILTTATTGALDTGNYASPRAQEVVRVGSYAVELARFGVKAELSATRHAAFHRYTFPKTDQAHILFDLAHVLSSTTTTENQHYDGGAITALRADRMEGFGRYEGGWNMGGAYKVYFCAKSDTPAVSIATWRADALTEGSSAQAESSERVGGVWNYRPTGSQVVNVKVGISFIDTSRACASADREITSWDIDAVRRAAIDEWNRVLNRVTIDDVQITADAKRVFYTAMYHAHLMPTERTGENPQWISAEPNYDDYYAIWDTFRGLHPLLALIQTSRHIDMIRSLIDIGAHTGYVPDARSGMDNGLTQGGSNANMLIAEAYLKKLDGIDYAAGYASMIHDAEDPPPDARREGRGGLQEYNSLGYLPATVERSGSRTLEYSANDWAIAQVARAMGKSDDFAKYKRRASSWGHLWNDDIVASGVRGFIAPRNADGTWALDGFSLDGAGEFGAFFYESNSWEYSLDVPHDVQKLMEVAGGKTTFFRRLEEFFDDHHWNISNEPSFFVPQLYIWADRHDRTVDRVREGLAHFTSAPDGIPGNDDSGAMSAWYLFNSIGFYPNAGTDYYLVGSPSFAKVTLFLGNGHTFTVLRKGKAGQRYVQSASLNGSPLTRAWFRHAEIASGGTLELVMGDAPSDFGSNAVPPSMSDP